LVPTHEVAQVRLPGTTLSLLSEFAAQNYGHLLYDAVPRLDLFERAGGTFDTVDRILCPGPSPLHRLWTDVGVPSDRVVCADPNVIYVVDHLVATSFPGTRRILPRWAARFLRGRLSGPPPARTGRRLYLGRSTSRRLSNEPLLVPHLLDLGFEVIDPGADGVDARAAFAEADVIVGAHGAAFADLVFCRAGTRVLEIVPTDHVYPHWFAASRSCDLDYRFVAADSAAVRPAGTLGPSPHDITVDLGQFMDALHQLIDELGTT